jgi:hypothetical protein
MSLDAGVIVGITGFIFVSKDADYPYPKCPSNKQKPGSMKDFFIFPAHYYFNIISFSVSANEPDRPEGVLTDNRQK